MNEGTWVEGLPSGNGPQRPKPPLNRAERRKRAKRLKRNGVNGDTIRARRSQVAKGILEHQQEQE